MKKFFLSLFIFIGSAIYVVYQHMVGTNTTPTIQITNSANAPVVQRLESPITSTTPTTPTLTPAPAPKSQGQYVNGTYTGNAADAYYGIVQVEATVQGGKLTDVTFLQYPNDRRTSQRINSQAMPLLRQEAIQAQSANVSGVSGASATSAGFRESLTNALAQAKS